MNRRAGRAFDIVIVGGGVIGLAMAASLLRHQAAKDLKIVLVDQQKPQRKHFSRDGVGNFDPRVSALTTKSRDLFESLELWKTHIQAAACPYNDMYVWDAEGTGHIAFSCREVNQPELGFIVENSVIDQALNSALTDQAGLTQLRGESVQQLESGQDGWVLTLSNAQCIQTRLLIAADGANSTIRQQAGFDCREWDYGQKAIVATVASQKPHQYTAAQCFGPMGPLAFLPLQDVEGTQHYSSIVWSCDADPAEDLLALDDKTFCTRLAAAFEERLGAIEKIGTRFSFPLWQRHSRDYVQEGLALIGDAAHTIHPLAGQGVNLGLQDVQVLSQVILTALDKDEDFATQQVLSRYERQRKGDNLSMMALMEAFKRGFASRHPGLRFLRNNALSLVDRAAPIKRQLILKAMGL
jgi:2-octaprenylphenol hydroxylase